MEHDQLSEGSGDPDVDVDVKDGKRMEDPGPSEGEEDTDDLEDDDTDEDEYEEDEEPALKYKRIGGALNDLLKKDSASALSVANKLLVGGFLVLNLILPSSYFINRR